MCFYVYIYIHLCIYRKIFRDPSEKNVYIDFSYVYTFFARSALSSLCALFRSCPSVRSMFDFWVIFTSRQKHCGHMRLPTETLKSGSWKVSKSYPPLISLASGIWHKRDPLFDHFLSNFFSFFVKKWFHMIHDVGWRMINVDWDSWINWTKSNNCHASRTCRARSV